MGKSNKTASFVRYALVALALVLGASMISMGMRDASGGGAAGTEQCPPCPTPSLRPDASRALAPAARHRPDCPPPEPCPECVREHPCAPVASVVADCPQCEPCDRLPEPAAAQPCKAVPCEPAPCEERPCKVQPCEQQPCEPQPCEPVAANDAPAATSLASSGRSPDGQGAAVALRGGAGGAGALGQSPQFAPPVPAEGFGYLEGMDDEGLEPLNLIYQHSPFHWYWHIDHWLANVKRPIRMHVDTGGDKCYKNSIVIVNHLSVKERKFDPAAYLKRCKDKGVTKVGAFHTGDIEINQNYAWYNDAAFVYRNHYPSRKQMEAKGMPPAKVHLMPLGSKNLETISLDDFRKTLIATRRKHWCGFIGALAHSQSRKDMARGLQEARLIPSQATYQKMGYDGGYKCAVYFSTSDWGNKKQMQPYEYRAVMEQTVFALVPLGRGPDSFRLYEALELGSIPIITDVDAFNLPLGADHPLPMVAKDQWHTVPKILKRYWDNKAEVVKLQKRIFEWWVRWKDQFRQGLADDVEGLFR